MQKGGAGGTIKKKKRYTMQGEGTFSEGDGFFPFSYVFRWRCGCHKKRGEGEAILERVSSWLKLDEDSLCLGMGVIFLFAW